MGEEHSSIVMFGSREAIPFTNGRFWEIVSLVKILIQIIRNHLPQLSPETHSPKSCNPLAF